MDEHTKQLGEALTAIIDAIEANEVMRDKDPLRRFVDKPRVITMADLDDPDDGADYVRDPIGTALRAGVRNFGKILAGIKTTREMAELAEAVAGEKNFQWRINVIDKNWDGITDKDGDVWIA